MQSYFGFRTVSIERGRVAVNGRPIYLKFVLDQGYWPESILTPPSDEAIQYDIRMTKEMGFNGARKHQKVEDPRFLYWADKMGFLVSGEMANAYEFDDDYVARFTDEWIAGGGARLQPSVDHHVGADQRELGRPEPARRSAAAASPAGALHADALARRHAPGDRQRRLGAHRHDRPVRASTTTRRTGEDL